MASERIKLEPFVTHYFEIEIDSITSGLFQEATGLSGQNEVYEIKEGGLNGYSHKFVTRTTYGDITFKRGFYADTSLFSWFQQTADYTVPERVNGCIKLIKLPDSPHFTGPQPVTSNAWPAQLQTGSPLATWHFQNAFPMKWEGPAFNAMSSALAIESMTLSVESIYLEVAT